MMEREIARIDDDEPATDDQMNDALGRLLLGLSESRLFEDAGPTKVEAEHESGCPVYGTNHLKGCRCNVEINFTPE
jgi:hypothetical protein